MFQDRLEIDSPWGQLPNGMTIEGMEASQATRNEVIASVFGRMPVGDVPGSRHRRYLMERRGDGVAIIHNETREAAGAPPEYAVRGRLQPVAAHPRRQALSWFPPTPRSRCTRKERLYRGVEVLALFPNKTWQRATTDGAGQASLDLYTAHMPMTVYVATPGVHGWGSDGTGDPTRAAFCWKSAASRTEARSSSPRKPVISPACAVV